jgi:uncharacterized protein
MVNIDDIRGLGRRIGREFHPQRVILFGSHASGTAGADSDVDLLVIGPFEGTGFRKSLEILNRLDVRLPIDLIVYRPEDAQRRYREGDPLVREAIDHGKVLYAERNR